MSTVVFPRFRRELYLHVFQNYNLPEVEPSLILGVHGPAGEGKSCQCSTVFDELGLMVQIVPITGFESNFAGDPAERIEKAYNDCIQMKLDGGNPIILIEDFDTAVGDFGAQYTVNMQHVWGTFMGLSEMVRLRPSQRVPVVVTGNDFRRLYAPLRRAGRIRLFEWIPTANEKAIVVRSLFPKLNDREALELVERCNIRCSQVGLESAPISLYAEIRSRLADDVVFGELEVGFPMFPTVEQRNMMASNVVAHLNAFGYEEILVALNIEIERRSRIGPHDRMETDSERAR